MLSGRDAIFAFVVNALPAGLPGLEYEQSLMLWLIALDVRLVWSAIIEIGGTNRALGGSRPEGRP
jgi:hypothetical protein